MKSVNTLLHGIIGDYLHKYASGTRHTAKAKRLDLASLMAFLGSHLNLPVEEVPLEAITHSSVEQFLEYRLRIGEAPATVTRRLATLKHFCRICAENRPDFKNPARAVRAPSSSLEKPRELDKETLSDILKYLEQRCVERPGFRSIRNKLIILTLLITGLRADEVRILRYGQVSDDGNWFTDVRTKGRKFRKVYVAEQLKEQLAQYWPVRESEIRRLTPRLPLSLNKKLPVFVGLRGATISDVQSFRLNEKTIWKIVADTSRGANVHPHLFRHTFAHRLLDTTNDIRLVAQALGHSDVRVTMKYTERSDEDVAAALEDSLARG